MGSTAKFERYVPGRLHCPNEDDSKHYHYWKGQGLKIERGARKGPEV
jgi:hypothetical protein